MGEEHRYRELSQELADERARLGRARAGYAHITRSRFHGLRMLWFSLKQVLGFRSESDIYAVWSPGFDIGLGPSTTKTSGVALAASPPPVELAEEAEQTLVEMWTQRFAERSMGETPDVTIVIPVYNHRNVTVRCLQSIARSWFESLNVQFVVVDDGSSDGTAEIVTRLPGVDYVRNGSNQGFIRACNRGAAIARGTYVCFLNNDTTVCDGWLDALFVTAASDPEIGIVGSKLVYPDGRLQEAGGIIWRDASGWNVGRFQDPDDPQYNFQRDVDYVSGASLLVRRNVFERLGGFSEAYRPAYYEDTDLCFGARALGFRVVYEPRSTVIHYEGVTSGDEVHGIKRFQEINRPVFARKWATALADRPENDARNVDAASRRGIGPTVLIVDSYVPLYDRESGSQRMMHLIKMLRRSGFGVVFLPDNFAAIQPYTRELQQMGVEVLHHVESAGCTAMQALERVLPRIGYAWISRADLYAKYAPVVRRNGKIRTIYDTVDLAYVRKRRENQLNGDTEAAWRELQRIELEAARSADVTVVVTPEERDELQAQGIADVCVVPNVHELAVSTERSYEESSGLLFIGSYNHPPNVDAATWLCRHVMPLVWQRLPDVVLTLLGSNPTDEVLGLASSRVKVPGQLRDVSPYFRSSRIFVAPLRYGAGMKGKIGHALSYALPVVTTEVGAEGLGLRHDVNALLAAVEPEAFAGAIVALYGDGTRWRRLSDAAAATIAPFVPGAVEPQLRAVFEKAGSLTPA